MMTQLKISLRGGGGNKSGGTKSKIFCTSGERRKNIKVSQAEKSQEE